MPSPKYVPWLYDGSDLTFVPLSLSTIEILRRWRNEDSTRRWFFTQDIISQSDQRKWFREIYANDITQQTWIAYLSGVPVGTGSLCHIDIPDRSAEWARAMTTEYARGKGVAGRICRTIREYGLDQLKLNRIYGSLFTANEVMMHIDVSAGYLPVLVEDDITHVELLRKDHRKD